MIDLSSDYMNPVDVCKNLNQFVHWEYLSTQLEINLPNIKSSSVTFIDINWSGTVVASIMECASCYF